MLDPLPLRNPPWLQTLSAPLAKALNSPTLPSHIHEILLSFAFYQFILTYASPALSSLFFPRSYAKLSPRTRFNWDVHVVSFVQAVLICSMAFYVMAADQERAAMDWRERIYGYTGALGLIQAFVTGYFVWDLYICARYLSMFGPGMLAHAVSALVVYGFGYRPFVNYYAPVFVLYELSSPFLNIHWFCDKMDLTGSTIQLVNGIFLLISFAGCRLVYGTYASYSVLSDIFKAVELQKTAPNTPPLALSPFALNATSSFNNPLEAIQVVRYAPSTPHFPQYLWLSYLISNVILNSLNWFWFYKMIATIRKRFDPPLGTRTKEKVETETNIARGVDDKGRKTLEVDGVEVRKRPSAQRAITTDDIPPPA